MKPETPGAAAKAEAVWCVVPVYNNAATVRTVALGCRRHVSRVLVVDDGSTDARVAELLADADVIVLRHEVNRGKGAALMTALDYIGARGGEFMLTVDADGQHDPDDIPAMLAARRADTIVIGRRDLSGPNVPESSRFGCRFSNFWFRLETGVSAPDTQSGFRGYPVGLVRALRLNGRAYDWELEVLVRAAWAGAAVDSVPIRVFYPPRGQRITHFKPWLDNGRLSLLHCRLVGRALVPWPHARLVPGGRKQGRDLE